MDLRANGNEMLLITQMKMHLKRVHSDWSYDRCEEEALAELDRAKTRMQESEAAKVDRGNYG